MNEGINAQTGGQPRGRILSKVMDWGKVERKLSPSDLQILQICASIPRRIPSDFEAMHAMDVLHRMRDQGFEVQR